MKRNARLTVRTLAAVSLLAGLGFPSSAAAEKGCDAWTWLPDFRCEGREARPEGSFNPMGMPFLFEDPYITTGLNFAYVYHRLPDSGSLDAAFDGGAAHIIALQVRVALTENLAFIATKDGFPVVLDLGDGAAVQEHTGILDLTLGFKYKLFETKDRDFIFTPALRYEIPLGSKKVFQGYGDGVMIPSASFRWGMKSLGLENANFIGSIGGQVPIDMDVNSDSIFYNIHLDYGFPIDNKVVKFIVPFFEMNGIYYTGGGDGTNPIYLNPPLPNTLPLTPVQNFIGSGPFEGVDYGNLGSQGIAGESIFVLGGGFRVPTSWGVSFGVMYEGPVSGRKDIHDQRFTFMATWEM